ncbi:MAG: hypothetical protein RL651_840 [Pseudomonadota bacterium]
MRLRHNDHQRLMECIMHLHNIIKAVLGSSVALLIATAPLLAHAETPQNFLDGFAQEAKAQNPAFKGFSAKTGEAFYKNKHGGDWSCSSCHTDNPMAEGKHAVTGKVIQPLSPNANPVRFTDSAKVNKWFKRNCNDVLKRECTPEEKGNLLTYLLSVKS